MIPKTIHYCWFSSEPFGNIQELCYSSWKRDLQDYHFHFWGPEDIPYEDYPILHKFVKERKWAMAADIVRLHALSLHGGLYFDLDVQTLKSFPHSFLENDILIGYEDDEAGLIEWHLIWAIPNHKFINDSLEYLNLYYSGNEKILPLPEVLTHIYNTGWYAFYVYPQLYFSPGSFLDESKKRMLKSAWSGSYAVHHFCASWWSWKQKVKWAMLKVPIIWKLCRKVIR